MSRGDKGRRGSPPRAGDKRPTELKIKLEYGTQIRRFGVRSFAELQTQTCELYQLMGTAFNLKYQDEADLVTVSNDKDLEECRRVQNSDTLRLSVFPIPISTRNHYSRSPVRDRSASPLRTRSESPLDSRDRSRSRSHSPLPSQSRSPSRSPSHALYVASRSPSPAARSQSRSRSPSARSEESVSRDHPKDRRDPAARELWEDLNWASLRELPRDTQNLMRKLVTGGSVTMKDFSPTIIPSLAQLPRGVQAQVLDRFAAADLTEVRSISGFFISILKQARAQVKADNERRDAPAKRMRTVPPNDDRIVHKRKEDQGAKQTREEQKREAARREAARLKKEKEEREIQRKEQARRDQRKKEEKETQRRQDEQKRAREQERRDRERRDEERREAERKDAERRDDERRAKEKREEQERRVRTEREQRRPRTDRDDRTTRRPAKRNDTKKSPVRDDSPRGRSPVAIAVTRRTVEISPSRSRSPSRGPSPQPGHSGEGDGRDGQDGVKRPRLLVKKRSGVEQEFRQSPESRHELTVVKKSSKIHFHTIQKAQPGYKKTFTEEPPPVFMCRNHHKPRTLQHLHPLTSVPGEYVCKYGHGCTNVN